MSKYFAELLGTFALVFCGTGAIVINDTAGGVVGHEGIAATFGLVVMGMIYALGSVSGAHFNPAVTLGFAVAGRFPLRQLLPYGGSQLVGALLASALLRLLFPEHATLGATLPAGSALQSLVLEAILTFFLMLVILQVALGPQEQRILAGLAIGATVGLEALFAGPICGASMNPVRSLAPALVSGHLAEVWLYMVGPVVGAVLAVGAWRLLNR